MKQAKLRDITAYKEYDLSRLTMENGNKVSIGRGNSNIIDLAEERITSDVGAVSRHHLVIEYIPKKDIFVVRDTDSRNGSWFRSSEGEGDRFKKRVLEDGDHLYLGGRDKKGIYYFGPLIYEEVNEETTK
jgi:pSer/pThr/pTyr-binding forkhead associated (FHA) protein